MLERYAFSFYRVIRDGESLLTKLRITASARRGQPYKDTENDLELFLKTLKGEAEALSLTQTNKLAEHVVKLIAWKKTEPLVEYTYVDAVADLDHLLFSFGNELRQEVIVRLPRDKQEYLAADNLFGPAVEKAFPSFTADIQSAGTCFAIGLWDACVFSLMQILQQGMYVLAQHLHVDYEYAQWERVITDIEKAVRQIDANSGLEWRERKTRFSAAASQFYFLKDAIRNHFIHGRERYDEGRAKSVYDHVREFTQSLAKAGLSEPPS
jgi:hypothetical protein